jgi:hypothetical protein
MMNWLPTGCSIAVGRTLIVDTKRRIVIGFAPNSVRGFVRAVFRSKGLK